MPNEQQKPLKEQGSNNKEKESLFDYALFLGFSKIPAFEQEMSKSNPYLVSLLTSGDLYLTSLIHQNQVYLGKFVKKMPSLIDLEHLEANILSLLQLLAPQFPSLAGSLKIFAAPQDASYNE